MKIRDKITLIFTLLSGSLLLFISIFIYYFSYRYTENEFYLRLRERTSIAAQAFLEEDELSTGIYDELRNRHLQVLPDEKELLLPVDTTERRVLEPYPDLLPAIFFDRIFDRGYAQIKTGRIYHSGLFYHDNEGDFIVIVSARNQYGTAEMRHLLNILIVSFLTGLILTYFVGTFYSARVLRPISDITESANEISATNLHLRLETGAARDELNELATTFNHMLDRLEYAFETQNNFINNASHELRNPLTAILGEAEVSLSKERDGKMYRESLLTIQKEAQRLDLLVNSLLQLAQTGMEDKRLIIEPLRIDELIMTVKQHLDDNRSGNRIVFDFSALPESADALLVHGNESLLHVAFTNLLDNACKFSEDQEVTVRIEADRESVLLSIADQGVGIPKTDINKIIEPFYRADNARGYKGFGVGLPLAAKIFTMHGGHLKIDSEVNKGTLVTVRLPNYRWDKPNKLILQTI